MPDGDREFTQLIEQVQDGSEDAVRELLDKYGGHIKRAVRRKLSRHLRSQFDSMDFCQAVWASFFADQERLPRFADEDGLIAFLSRVASNKVVDEYRRRTNSQNRNSRFEIKVDDDAPDWCQAFESGDPTPSQIVSAKEQMHRLVDGKPSYYEQILRLRADGRTFDQIAEDTGMNEKTVRRVIRRLSARLEKK